MKKNSTKFLSCGAASIVVDVNGNAVIEPTLIDKLVGKFKIHFSHN